MTPYDSVRGESVSPVLHPDPKVQTGRHGNRLGEVPQRDANDLWQRAANDLWQRAANDLRQRAANDLRQRAANELSQISEKTDAKSHAEAAGFCQG